MIDIDMAAYEKVVGDYADKKDADNRLSPYLVPWDKLEPEIKKYDTDAIQTLANNLCRCGYKVVKIT